MQTPPVAAEMPVSWKSPGNFTICTSNSSTSTSVINLAQTVGANFFARSIFDLHAQRIGLNSRTKVGPNAPRAVIRKQLGLWHLAFFKV